MIGQVISHYRIVEKLGEGGMGIVYKAEDTRLKRTVALKFLRHAVIDNPEHKERFMREAQAAAALDHPNICTIYEIDEADGQTFLSMAFLKGQTVKDKITDRPLKLKEALDIAIQTAQGLHAAHEKGIVHRDVKSANLIVTPQGQVKIMDFGLAQLADRSKLTKTTTILGTPAYMSPEQTRGERTDRRTDIWSLAVVTYEMVTGLLPFGGEREEAVLYAIANEDPEPITGLRVGVPMELDRIVSKAMSKSPDERYQHIDEMLVDLHALQKTAVVGGRSLRIPPPAKLPLRELAAWLLAGIAVIALAFVALLDRQGRPPPRVIFTIDSPAASFSDPGSGAPWALAFSPDGSTLAFAAVDNAGTRHLFVRRLESALSRILPGTEGARQPFWSPDGRFIAFFANGRLLKINVEGGPIQEICGLFAPLGGRGGSWSPSGEIVFQPASRLPLSIVTAAGGEPRPVTTLDETRQENSHRWPQFLPDGRRFLYTARATAENTGVYVASLDPGLRKRILTVQSSVQYAPPRNGRPGFLLFVRDGTLFAQPFDADTLEPSGEASPLAEQVFFSRSSAVATFSVSADGSSLAYLSSSNAGKQLTWFGRRGEQKGTLGTPVRQQRGPRLSPDGRHVVMTREDPHTGNRDLWLLDLQIERFERFTLTPSNEWNAAWSPDGRRLVFSSDPTGLMGAYTQPIDKTAPAQAVTSFHENQTPTDWSPDGRFVAIETTDLTKNLWIVPADGSSDPIPFSQTDLVEADAKFSPDGRWIAYTADASGQLEVYVHSYENGISGKVSQTLGQQVSIGGGAGPRWRGDSRELFYLRPDGTVMAVQISSGPRLEVSAPAELFQPCPGVFFRSYWESTYDVTPDGGHFLFNCPTQDEKAAKIHVLLNWAEGLTEP